MAGNATEQVASGTAQQGESSEQNESFLARNWQKIAAIVIWVALAGSLFAYITINDLTISEALRNIVGLLQTPLGPLLFILIYTLRPLTFFSATVLTLLAGSLWGGLLGIIYTVIGSNLSSTFAYYLGRFLGKGLIDESKTEGTIARYTDRMRKNSFETVLIMRFIFLPYDLVSYLSGLLKIDFKAFILATIIGSIPGTIAITLAGASVPIDTILMDGFRPQFNPWTFAAAAALFVVSLGFSRYLKSREQNKEGSQAT